MKVLVAFDSTPASHTALGLVDGLPWPRGTLVQIVHVLPSLALLGGLSVPPLATSTGRGVDLGEIADALRRPGIDVETKIVHGESPADALLAAAAAFGADLIVAGHRGHGPLTTAFLGSVARELAERSRCPVLVARKSRCRTAVLAEDGSDCAFRARRALARWPVFAGAEVHVVSVSHVMRPLLSGVTAGVYSSAREAQRELETESRHAHSVLAEAAASDLRLAGVHASAAVRDGDPAEQILEHARSVDADLIVVGTRGRSPVTRSVFGSVARAVLLTAPCSVLVVPSA